MQQIKRSKDYDKFSILTSNRVVQKNKINGMREALKGDGNLTIDYPILVDKKMNILEGQTRYYACVEENRWVYYKIAERVTINHIAKANSLQKKWNMKDYLHSYLTLYNEGQTQYHAYKIFSDYMDKIPKLGPSTAMMILCGDRRASMYKFQQGEMTIHDLVTLSWSDQFAEDLRMFAKYIPDFYWHRSFVMAFHSMYLNKRYDHKRMTDRMSKQSRKLRKSPSCDLYLENLEEIYNWNIASNRKVRFT